RGRPRRSPDDRGRRWARGSRGLAEAPPPPLADPPKGRQRSPQTVAGAEVHDQPELTGHLRPLVEESTSLREPAAHRLQLGLIATNVAPERRILLVISKQRLDPVDRLSGGC